MHNDAKISTHKILPIYVINSKIKNNSEIYINKPEYAKYLIKYLHTGYLDTNINDNDLMDFTTLSERLGITSLVQLLGELNENSMKNYLDINYVSDYDSDNDSDNEPQNEPNN